MKLPLVNVEFRLSILRRLFIVSGLSLLLMGGLVAYAFTVQVLAENSTTIYGFGENQSNSESGRLFQTMGQQVVKPIGNWDWIAKRLGLDPHTMQKMVHDCKQTFGLRGDEDLAIDLETGDIYDAQTGEIIGNAHEGGC